MTDTHSPSGSTLAEAEAFLAAHPEIEAFDIVLHDANGIGRGKIIRRHELLSFYKNGRHLPISILGLDICGEDVHETGLIWDQGDGDLRAWPIPGSLKPLHNTTPPRGEVFMSMYDLDGHKMTSDPRHALQRQVEALAGMGLHPAGAFELEFFLLSNERTGIANVGLCRERLDYARELAGRYTQAGKPLLDDPKLRADIAMLEAETRALEITNWRFLLTDSEQKRLPAFASVLKLKGTELQQEINALLARIVGPGGLERRSADEARYGGACTRPAGTPCRKQCASSASSAAGRRASARKRPVRRCCGERTTWCSRKPRRERPFPVKTSSNARPAS
mgnify:CR=1 FL=1